MKKLVYVLFISLSLGVMSCGKDGDIGPEGPRGERGERGEKGETGADGTTILNGSADPTGKEGSVGDFYLNTNSYVLFGPKTKDGWGKGESILGATGAKGAKGDKGEKGDTGAKGNKGDKGNTGAKGDKGEKGDTGAKGDKGDKGNTGAKGDKGEKGDTGAKGNKGDKGNTGARGAKGDKGEADYVILSGTNDPTTSVGKTGDFYYQTNSKTLFFRKSSGWETAGKLANTIQFTKTGFDLPASTVPSSRSVTIDLPWEIFEKSMVAVYLQRQGASNDWIPMPGRIKIASDITPIDIRFVKSPANDKARIYFSRETPGGRDHLHNKVRIIVTEADVFETVSRSVDFRNYDEVRRYFDLQE